MFKVTRALCLMIVWSATTVAVAQEARDPAELAAEVLKKRMVSIEVSIVELDEKPSVDETLDAESSQKLIARIRELETQGKLAGLTRVRLSTLEDEQAAAQFGEQTSAGIARPAFQPPPAGERGGPRMAVASSARAFGTMVTTIPRIEPGDTILMELQIEKSSPSRDAQPVDPNVPVSAVGPKGTSTTSIKTTVRATNGKTMIVQGTGSVMGNDVSRTVILLTASIDGAAPAVEQKAEALKVFRLKSAAVVEVQQALQTMFPKKRVTIAAHRLTNSLLIRGNAVDLETIEGLLLTLDEAPKPVP